MGVSKHDAWQAGMRAWESICLPPLLPMPPTLDALLVAPIKLLVNVGSFWVGQILRKGPDVPAVLLSWPEAVPRHAGVWRQQPLQRPIPAFRYH